MAHVTVDHNPDPRTRHVVGSTPTAGPFNFNFVVFGEEDVHVFVGDSDTPLTLNADYMVDLTPGTEGGYVGGDVTLTNPVADTTVTLAYEPLLDRQSDFPTTGKFNITTLNTTLDRLVTMIQYVRGLIGRTVILPVTSAAAELVLPALEAGKVLFVNATGDGFEFKTVAQLGGVTNATESAAGIAEIATTPETDGLTDDQRFVTPLKLAPHTAKGKHMIPLECTRFRPASTAPVFASNTMGTNGQSFASLDFGDSATERAWAKLAMPKSWDLSSVSYEVIWSASAGTVSQGVVWEVALVCRGDDDPLDVAPGTAVKVTDAYLAANDHHTSPLSADVTPNGSPAENDTLWIRLSRLPADAGDTKTGVAKFIELRLYVNTTKGNDA